MSDMLIDLGIAILLLFSAGFAGIGLIGQLLFPDTRSRMFTAVRATMISLGAMIVAVLAYASYEFQSTGVNYYQDHEVLALLILVVVAGGNWMVYRMIRERTSRESYCKPVTDEKNKNSG